MNNTNLRKAYIHNFMVTLRIKHDEIMNHIEHIFPSVGNPEEVCFNFEIGYEYKPITESSTIDEVFEYTFICKYLKSLEDKTHTCVVEYLLEEVTNYILNDSRVFYVKSNLTRHKTVNGSIGVGLDKYRK